MPWDEEPHSINFDGLGSAVSRTVTETQTYLTIPLEGNTSAEQRSPTPPNVSVIMTRSCLRNGVCAAPEPASGWQQGDGLTPGQDISLENLEVSSLVESVRGRDYQLRPGIDQAPVEWLSPKKAAQTIFEALFNRYDGHPVAEAEVS